MSTYKTVTEIKKEIAKQKSELEKLQHQLDVAKSESPEIQLAKQLHNMVCSWNHTDGCGWYYESKNGVEDWNGHAHGEYLKRARILIHRCEKENISVDTAIELYKFVRGY
jgi:hypothetical protein